VCVVDVWSCEESWRTYEDAIVKDGEMVMMK
jgi:hypothetical protein